MGTPHYNSGIDYAPKPYVIIQIIQAPTLGNAGQVCIHSREVDRTSHTLTITTRFLTNLNTLMTHTRLNFI